MKRVAIFVLCLLFASAAQAATQVEVMEFSASWCPHCREVAPLVQAYQRAGWTIQVVDGDTNVALRAKHHVAAYPTFIAFYKGQEIRRMGGALKRKELESLFVVPR